MGRYILQRIISLVPILLGVSLLTFALINLVPGDPVEVFLRVSEIMPTPQVIAEVRAEMGLDKPLYIQYFDWLSKVLQLDFGNSYISKKPVWDEIVYYFPATIQLAIAATVLMLVISLPVGIGSALYKDRIFDQFSRVLSFLGASMPSFWLGLLLIYLFSMKLDLLPTQGHGSFFHLILPALTLALGHSSAFIRLLRTSMLENMNQYHVLYARARGVRERVIVIRHVLKNALIPVVTALGMSFGHMLAGSVVVESVFAWPGLGRYCISSIFNRDYPVIQAYVLIVAVIVILCNLLVDIIYHLLNPKMMKEGDV